MGSFPLAARHAVEISGKPVKESVHARRRAGEDHPNRHLPGREDVCEVFLPANEKVPTVLMWPAAG